MPPEYKIYRSPEGRIYRVKAGSKDAKRGVGPFEAIYHTLHGGDPAQLGYDAPPAEFYDKKTGKWKGGEFLSEEGAKRKGYVQASDYNYPVAIPPMAPPPVGYSAVQRPLTSRVENDPLVAASSPVDMSRFSAPPVMVPPEQGVASGVVVPPRRPEPPKASTVRRAEQIKAEFAQAKAQALKEAEDRAAQNARDDRQFQDYGGQHQGISGLYRSPTGTMPLDAATESRIAANSQPVSNGSVSSLYTTSPYRPSKSQPKPRGSWKDNYRSMDEFRQAEDAALSQQGKFRYIGPEVGGATVYMPSSYSNNSQGYAKYRQDQAAALAQRQAAMAQNPAFQQPIMQNAGRPLYGADLARARAEQEARYRARLQAGKNLYQQPVVQPQSNVWL